jgi:hypothetical protein
MKTKNQTLKVLLKQKATEIRSLRKETKEYQKSHGGSCGGRQSRLEYMKDDYRHHHIAYSMLHGKTIEQIEPKSYTDPNWNVINIIKEQYENVRSDAA